MKVIYYGLYDGVAKNVINLFNSSNDDSAQRAAHYIVRGKDFDRIAGKDYVIVRLFVFDSETGLVSENEMKPICSLGSALDAYLAELKEEREGLDLCPTPLKKPRKSK